MNKNLFWLIALLFPLSFGFVSCAEDTAVEDPYANWQVRNEHYIDSIADVAQIRDKKLENGKYIGIIKLRMKVRLRDWGVQLLLILTKLLPVRVILYI